MLSFTYILIIFSLSSPTWDTMFAFLTYISIVHDLNQKRSLPTKCMIKCLQYYSLVECAKMIRGGFKAQTRSVWHDGEALHLFFRAHLNAITWFLSWIASKGRARTVQREVVGSMWKTSKQPNLDVCPTASIYKWGELAVSPICPHLRHTHTLVNAKFLPHNFGTT